MATQTRTWTVAELDELHQDQPGDRHEIIDGDVFVTPSPVPFHQSVSIEFSSELREVVRRGHLGRIYTAPIDVQFSERDRAVPDIAFVSRECLGIVGPVRIDGAPDLIVEILSPSTRRRDATTKRALYERYGVREYWLIDPIARTVTVYVLRGGRYELLPHFDGVLRSVVLPGLAIEVAAVFAAAEE